MTETNESKSSRQPRWILYVKWTFIALAGLYSAFHAGFVIENALDSQKRQRLLDIVFAHYACIIVVPFAGYAALALVWLLESLTEGQIKSRRLGLILKAQPLQS